MKKIGYVIVLGASLLLTGCGMGVEGDAGQASLVEIEWKPLKVVSGREIIAELEQTVKETPIRDQKVLTIIEDEKNGVFGKPSKGSAEDMAVQLIEMPAVLEGLQKVYGDEAAFEQYGVIFMENQSHGDEQSGGWIGIKEPDEKFRKFIRELQFKVDAGEILAAPIYIFRSDFTQAELYDLQEEVLKVLQPMHSGSGSFGLSVNSITGAIEISHDFLTEAQQVELREEFEDWTIQFEQEGRIAPKPGESIITHPDEKFTTTEPKEGGYVMEASKNEFLVTGGEYGAIRFKYPGEIEQLKVGQRIEVESTGMILYSYPGQGTAKYIDILPEYKPENAKLSESEVVQQAVALAKEKSDWVTEIQSISYDKKTSKWHVTIQQDEEIVDFQIADR